jgi:hypothetical protein
MLDRSLAMLRSSDANSIDKEDGMKKLIVFGVIMALFTMGCGHMAKESEFYDHNTMYRDWDHMKFSLGGYKNPTAEVAQVSASQEWWGLDIPFVPAQ